MDTGLQEKYQILQDYLQELGSVAVAFSSGVDSTFLLKVAKNVLGDQVIAITARSCSFPKRELQEAVAFCEREGIHHIVVESEELEIEGFRENPKNRCYLCKRELFEKIWEIARANGCSAVCDGSNMDDNGDYRPGLVAIAELSVSSPLRYAHLTKADIRALSKELGLPTADKPSFACLASRFSYGETISEEKLAMVDKGEQLLFDLGFSQFRVRIHGNVARIEVLPKEFSLLLENREMIYEKFLSFGFVYVAMDLKGYRTGSMNETLSVDERQNV